MTSHTCHILVTLFFFPQIRDQEQNALFSALTNTTPFPSFPSILPAPVTNWKAGAGLEVGASPGQGPAAQPSSLAIQQHQRQDSASSPWLVVTDEDYFQKGQLKSRPECCLIKWLLKKKNGSTVGKKKKISVTTQRPISTIYLSLFKDFPLSISLNLSSKARIECFYIFQLLNAVRMWRQTTSSRQFRFYNICWLHERWKTVVVLNHCFVQSGLHTFNREPSTIPSAFAVWKWKGEVTTGSLPCDTKALFSPPSYRGCPRSSLLSQRCLKTGKMMTSHRVPNLSPSACLKERARGVQA